VKVNEDSVLDVIKKLQSSREGRIEAREVCFRELSQSPQSHRLKLALAKLFYLDGYYDFSLDILLSLKNRVSSPLLDNLIKLLGGSINSGDRVLAQMSVSSKK
jgi:hypothetical protein